MRFNTAFSGLACTALILAQGLIGCNSQDKPGPSQGPVQDTEGDAWTPARKSDYVAQVTQLKSRVSDPSEYETELARLQSRFGLAPKSPAGTAASAEAAPGQGSRGGLAKAAADDSVGFSWTTVKSVDIFYPLAMVATFTVQNGAKMSAYTDRISAACDPYMVAFYSGSGDPDRAGAVRIIGLSDDEGGNLNSRIDWTNTTGAARKVKVIVLAYNGNSFGATNLEYKTASNAIPLVSKGYLTATRIFSNMALPPDACNGGPVDTRITLQWISGGGYIGYGTGLLGVNTSTLTGLHVYNRDASAGFDFGLENQALKANGRNFLLPYLENRDGYVYDNGNHWLGTQVDKLQCL
jgi:hypothetical protein